MTSDTLLAAAAARAGITENANALPLGRSLYGYWARADVLNALLGDGAAAALQTAAANEGGMGAMGAFVGMGMAGNVTGGSMQNLYQMAQNQQGGIIKKENFIHASNVMYLHNGKATRLGAMIKDGKKVRVAKKTGEVID